MRWLIYWSNEKDGIFFNNEVGVQYISDQLPYVNFFLSFINAGPLLASWKMNFKWQMYLSWLKKKVFVSIAKCICLNWRVFLHSSMQFLRCQVTCEWECKQLEVPVRCSSNIEKTSLPQHWTYKVGTWFSIFTIWKKCHNLGYLWGPKNWLKHPYNPLFLGSTFSEHWPWFWPYLFSVKFMKTCCTKSGSYSGQNFLTEKQASTFSTFCNFGNPKYPIVHWAAKNMITERNFVWNTFPTSAAGDKIHVVRNVKKWQYPQPVLLLQPIHWWPATPFPCPFAEPPRVAKLQFFKGKITNKIVAMTFGFFFCCNILVLVRLSTSHC